MDVSSDTASISSQDTALGVGGGSLSSYTIMADGSGAPAPSLVQMHQTNGGAAPVQQQQQLQQQPQESSRPYGRPPILILEPLNGTFFTKRLDLSEPIKVGRKVSVKVGSEPNNGIFDSKVLSRTHAEIWFENGKVWIKDVKSSNGTFVNKMRLSEEGQASRPFEIKSGDELEFGIDIMNDDGHTIMYNKVSCMISIVEATPEELRTMAAAIVPSPTRSSQAQILKRPVSGIRLENVLSVLDEEIRRATDASAELEQLKTTLADLDTLINRSNGSNNASLKGPVGAAAPAVEPKSEPVTSVTSLNSHVGETPSSSLRVLPVTVSIGTLTDPVTFDVSPTSTSADKEEALAVNMTKLEEQVKQQQAQLDELRRKLGDSEAAASSALAALAAQESLVKETRTEVLRLHVDADSARKRVNEITSSKETELAELKVLHEKEVMALKTAKESAEMQLELVKKEVEELKSKVKKAESEVESLKKKETTTLRATAAATAAHKQHMEGLGREMERLKSDHAAALSKAVADAAQSAIKQSQAELKKLQEKHDADKQAHAQAVAASEKRATELAATVHTLEQQLAQSHNHVKDLNEKLVAAAALNSSAASVASSPTSSPVKENLVSAVNTPNNVPVGLRQRKSKSEMKAERAAAKLLAQATLQSASPAQDKAGLVDSTSAVPAIAPAAAPAVAANDDNGIGRHLVQALLYLGAMGVAALGTYLVLGNPNK